MTKRTFGCYNKQHISKLEPVFVKHYAPNICFPKYGLICTMP